MTIKEVLSVPVSLVQPTQFPYSEQGQALFEEMVISRDVDREDNPILVEDERRFAEEVVKKLDTVLPDNAQAVVQAIKNWDFTSPILLNKDFPYFILEALRIGLISSHEAATALNFWGALQYHQGPHDLRPIRFDSPDAQEFLDETFKGFLEGEKRAVFMEKMGQLPASEQVFLMVPDLQKGNTRNMHTVSQVIGFSYNVFNRVQTMRIVPSVGMMQAFLDAEFIEPVQIKTRIYLSTEKQIRENRLSSSHDMMMPFPNMQGSNHCPVTADSLPAPWYDFPHHDFYHASLASAVGTLFREVSIISSDAVNGRFAVGFIDMQFDRFLLESKLRTKVENFWTTVMDNFIDFKIDEKDQLTFLDAIYEAIIQKDGISKVPTLVDLLIRRGTFVRNEKKLTFTETSLIDALKYIAKKGDCATLRELLTKCPEFNLSTRQSAAIDAAENGHFEVVEALLEGCKEPLIFGRIIQAAAKNGHVRIVEAYANKSSSSPLGYALIIAAQKNHPLVVEKLLACQIPASDMQEALGAAQRLKHIEIVEMLSKKT